MVLDTHVFVWHVLADPQSKPTVNLLQSSEKKTISSISVWEIHMMLERGYVQTHLAFGELIKIWLATYEVEIQPIDAEIALLARSLPFSHRDPADRFIAATAYHLQVPLVTHDENLRSLPWLTTLP